MHPGVGMKLHCGRCKCRSWGVHHLSGDEEEGDLILVVERDADGTMRKSEHID